MHFQTKLLAEYIKDCILSEVLRRLKPIIPFVSCDKSINRFIDIKNGGRPPHIIVIREFGQLTKSIIGLNMTNSSGCRFQR